jgi:glycosyltransferase involved in cell wall biosynthesis
MLALSRLLGMKLVADFACVLWPKYHGPTKTWRALYRLDRPVLSRTAFALLSVSCDVTRQLTEVAGGRPRPILEYLPLYRPERFARLPPPGDRPFRVAFAGRVEEIKGAFTLLELAHRFEREGRDVVIEVCGEGAASADLARRVAEEGLSGRLVLHGHCAFDRLREVYARSHVVIVPTTSRFIEGFNMVAAEAVLSGRPVITSDVCPAVHYLGEAAVRVAVDDVDAYARAIARLADRPEEYLRVQAETAKVGPRFFDGAHSLGSALRAVFEAAMTGASPRPRVLETGTAGALAPEPAPLRGGGSP